MNAKHRLPVVICCSKMCLLSLPNIYTSLLQIIMVSNLCIPDPQFWAILRTTSYEVCVVWAPGQVSHSIWVAFYCVKVFWYSVLQKQKLHQNKSWHGAKCLQICGIESNYVKIRTWFELKNHIHVIRHSMFILVCVHEHGVQKITINLRWLWLAFQQPDDERGCSP